jgi:hypothetical protein
VNRFDPYAYLDAAAAAIDLPVPPESRDAVAANLMRLHALAQQVLAFDVADAGGADQEDRA